jgi:hypothetical protein
MPSSGMLRLGALVRADFSEEPSASLLLIMEALGSSETSVLTKATRRNISEDSILNYLMALKRITFSITPANE